MNTWTVLHKHSRRTSLCVSLIPLFDTVTPEDVQGGTDGRGGELRNTVLQQTQTTPKGSFFLLCAFKVPNEIYMQ